ncbi:MAG: CBS domain-containing protein [Bacilli bacterium]|nr:CBS domain-containing protein [Bacilli bacterium]MBO6285892.1 CBS domain-containing protein [Bacilli bacterium]
MTNLLKYLIPKAEVDHLDGGDTLRMAIEKMSHHHYTMIPVLGQQGHYLYSISTGDILFYLTQNDLTLRQMESVPLETVPIHRPIMALPATCSEKEVGRALLSQNYVPLVDERGIFIGIITRKRLVSALSGEEEA